MSDGESKERAVIRQRIREKLDDGTLPPYSSGASLREVPAGTTPPNFTTVGHQRATGARIRRLPGRSGFIKSVRRYGGRSHRALGVQASGGNNTMKPAALMIAMILALIARPASAQVGRWQMIGPAREGSGVYLLDTMTGCTWRLGTRVDKGGYYGHYWDLLGREGVGPGETAIRLLIPKQCLQIDGGVVWRDRPSN
jgi:hypothetical protein